MIIEVIQYNLQSIANLDLLAVGLAVAASLVFGSIVFLTDRKSVTNKSFLLFLLLTAMYSIANYFQYHSSDEQSLQVLRVVVFFATWHAFSLFQLFLVFPHGAVKYPRWHYFGILPLTIFTSLLTLSPLVFSGINQTAAEGHVTKVINGPAYVVFVLAILVLVFGAIYMLARKIFFTKGLERRQVVSVAIGTAITFSLLIVFNMVLPAVKDDARFIAFAPVFFLPFMGFTFYATVKHHLLNVKVISTQILTFILAAITLLEVIFTQDALILTFRLGVFVMVLAFGILLMRSVQREVEQRQEMERLTVQLKEANLKLEDLSRFKSQLLSLASHQIKSPLAAIKGFASILLEGLYGPVDGKVRETVEKMKKSADQLVELINTLLDVRKVEEGRMDYQFAKIDLVKLIRSTVEELEPLASQKKLDFGFTTSVPELWISADAQKLKQVLQNTIDNSIKYTPTGYVKVALREEDGAALFSVSDSGLGIPQDLIPHLFEEFIREERVRKEVMGTGLGLYIAKKIVEAHNGRIWVESKGANRGAEFYVTLKKVPA